eukprot:Skav214270  [mRNA]  locus=scaffold642:91254:96870:+ [translate_table: standard]
MSLPVLLENIWTETCCGPRLFVFSADKVAASTAAQVVAQRQALERLAQQMERQWPLLPAVLWLSVFGLLIMESARHMQDHWDVYQKGADQLTKDLLSLFSKVPDSFKKQYQDASAEMVKSAQDVFYSLLGALGCVDWMGGGGGG